MKNQNQQLIPTSDQQTNAQAEVLKLGLDIHKSKYVVVHQMDNQPPKSPQKFSPEAFLAWIAGQRGRATKRLLKGVKRATKRGQTQNIKI